jgi:hypothetical protein
MFTMQRKKPVKQGFMLGLVGFPLFVVTIGIPGITVLAGGWVAVEYGTKVCDALDEFASFKRYGTPEVKPTNVVRVRKDKDEPKMCMPEMPARDLMDEKAGSKPIIQAKASNATLQ